MREFYEEAKAFGARKLAETADARQIVAMRLVCGIDLSAALDAAPELRAKLIQRVERTIERERLKGMRRHWSYDLNRHIALKQVLDRLREIAGEAISSTRRMRARRPNDPAKQNGARRRR